MGCMAFSHGYGQMPAEEYSIEAIRNDYLGKIEFTTLEVDEESIEIAQRIIDLGILKAKSFDDCQHIAIAVVNDCDIVLSWNFKHMVNIKTIRGVRAITNLEGYKDIEIVSPSVLLEGEDDYE